MVELPTESDPVRIVQGDALDVLRSMPDGCVDAVVTDPPYPCITREYGYWTEAEWFALMNPVVEECRRVLKPTGSAVFVLQPNSEKVGRMRTWLWEFMVKWGREWGMVQDAWWWNDAAMPGGGEGNRRDLLRASVKACVWLGETDCYRSRRAVMVDPAESTMKFRKASARYLRKSPGCHGIDPGAVVAKVQQTGEVTPFNLLPFAREGEAGRQGHPAGTPLALMRWWVRYICPAGGTVFDPFLGSGTAALAALAEGRKCVGVERHPPYADTARRRVAEAMGGGLLKVGA